MQFKDLNLIEPIQLALKKSGYIEPTPIQSQAIPHLLLGKDLLGCAQTGTGKTAAFALPILNHLATTKSSVQPKNVQVLVLTPTRELALQIYESFETYGAGLRLKTAVVFGGVGQGPQVKAVAGGVDILVATPGRLLDLISQNHINIRNLKTFVLDEADRMLDMGFIRDIQKVLTMIPKQRQTLFFSATMPNDILKLANSMLTNPIKVEVTPVSSTAEKIDQRVMYVEKSQKKDLLRFVLNDPNLKRVIVFTRTKHGANRVSELLTKNRVPSEAIHGNKSQNARQRALDAFKEGKIRVLIATDIAARGIDVDGISHVINYEVPNVAESYVHRIGRTARAGAEGSAISFCDAEERSFIRDIEKLIGQAIPVDHDHPYHSVQVENARVMSSGKAKALIEAGNRSGGSHHRHRSHAGPSRPKPKPHGSASLGGGQTKDATGRPEVGPVPKKPKRSFFGFRK
ncbi:MAG: DEAD/DEAH box helicase [Bdellovibrionales bacterium RIFCSPHIGHO2_01_FULL_40_29]|nr:MAG: DEAD/DEAH box helicase [Bdellovibrionales bacterium RIFCSPHIGHO2_01_FULL_40_29]OFZ33411.1 MAG: DEAD/DEAH box helicase [Bdellovibrionales bacterium RIFCSPHIGHO2_02_FULL_40_15]